MTKNKKMYFVYHIPKVKVGMTSDLGKRVFEEQGYDPSEVQILYVTRNMADASESEISYQKSLGYVVDRMSYKDLMSSKKVKKGDGSFKINVTDMTTTFPVWKADVKKYLNKNLNKVITLNTGEAITLTTEIVDWIDSNSVDSQYTKGRAFVYNKALLKFIKNSKSPNDINVVYDLVDDQKVGNYEKLYSHGVHFELIRVWAKERGLYDKGDIKTQYIKLQEEAGEVARAIIKNDAAELKDGIGDMVVVLTNLAYLAGFTIEDCIGSAYDVISKRKGKMFNGSFVKNTL